MADPVSPTADTELEDVASLSYWEISKQYPPIHLEACPEPYCPPIDDKPIDAYDWPSLVAEKRRILAAAASRDSVFFTCIVCGEAFGDNDHPQEKIPQVVAYCPTPAQPGKCAYDARAYRHLPCWLKLPECVKCRTAYLDEASARQELVRIRMNATRRITYACARCIDSVDGVTGRLRTRPTPRGGEEA